MHVSYVHFRPPGTSRLGLAHEGASNSQYVILVHKAAACGQSHYTALVHGPGVNRLSCTRVTCPALHSLVHKGKHKHGVYGMDSECT